MHASWLGSLYGPPTLPRCAGAVGLCAPSRQPPRQLSALQRACRMGATPSAPVVPTSGAACQNVSSVHGKYSELARQLSVKGFDAAGIAASSRLFTSEQVPRRYSDPPWSLPEDAVRVLALSMSDSDVADAATRRVALLALRAARDVADALPSGSQTWLPQERGLHATVFHPGLSPQADTLGRLCNLPLPVPPAGCWQRSGFGTGSPSEAELRHELRAARRLAARTVSRLEFDVDRLVMTSTGVMLLLLRPRHAAGAMGELACVDALRAAAAKAFPRAARKQTNGLVHVSLLRILSLPGAQHHANASEAVRAVTAVLERWSRQLRALPPVTAKGLLYVRETQIMTLEGETFRLRFGEAAHDKPRAKKAHTPAKVAVIRPKARSSQPLGDVLSQGGTRTGYDLDREDSQIVR